MAAGRRKLTAVDDPLAAAAPQATPARPSRQPTDALYVRLPRPIADQLARAAFELRVHKRELVAALISAHVDGGTESGRDALRDTLARYRGLSS